MDLTPAFFDRWREHRELAYLDRVREILDAAELDEEWLERSRLKALAIEARASLGHADIEVEEATVRAVLDRNETDGVPAEQVSAVRSYGDAHRAARAAGEQRAVVTPELLDDLHARLCAGTTQEHNPHSDAPLRSLCDWLAAPPQALHPVVVAALAEVELLRERRWPDGNARLARLAVLLLLTRDGYDYRGLLAPSATWSDPRRLPDRPVAELSPEQAQTDPAVEHAVRCIALGVRDMIAWVRVEEGGGSWRAMAFGFPLQP
jgi:Fic family protein